MNKPSVFDEKNRSNSKGTSKPFLQMESFELKHVKRSKTLSSVKSKGLVEKGTNIRGAVYSHNEVKSARDTYNSKISVLRQHAKEMEEERKTLLETILALHVKIEMLEEKVNELECQKEGSALRIQAFEALFCAMNEQAQENGPNHKIGLEPSDVEETSEESCTDNESCTPDDSKPAGRTEI